MTVEELIEYLDRYGNNLNIELYVDAYKKVPLEEEHIVYNNGVIVITPTEEDYI